MEGELGSMHRVFKFKELKTVSNKLINKNIPGLQVKQKHNTVECIDSQTEPSIVKSESSLQNDCCLPYFEAEVLGIATEDTINVGLIAKDNTNKLAIGKSNNSFGYFRGELFLNKRKVGGIVPHEKLKEGDYIGIGVNCHKNKFIVIKNGKIVSNSIAVPENWHQYYPAVGVSNESEKVRVIYNPKDFRCKYQELIKEIESQIEQQVKKQEINSTQIYPLVYEYLEFNGFSKTLGMLREKEKDMLKIARLTKDPGHPRPSFSLEDRENQKMISQDDDMNEPLKFRNRIMSERLPPDEEVIVPDENRRKNTEMNIQPYRKDSYMSNISNVSNYNPSEDNFYCPEQQRQFEEPIGANEKFLLNQKVQIVELIRQKKIEKALELMERIIPEFLQESYIVAFMKAHIFLRIIRQQSNVAGLKYSRQEKAIFENHIGTLFPFYQSQKQTVVWKPLKHIYTAMVVNTKNGKQKCYDMLSDKQFFTFASYINSLIMTKMGYLGCSRLSLCVHNTTKVLEKLRSYKGHSCGMELTL